MTPSDSLNLAFELQVDDEHRSLADEAELQSLSTFILQALLAQGEWEVVVALVPDDELQAMHLQFMGIDEPTDIMTFPYGPDAQGGDLAISVDHALERATEWGHSPKQEIQFLVAHGVLHLLGWQDTSEEERAGMLARQSELIDAWRQAGNR